MSTATLPPQKKTTLTPANPAEKLENGVPVAARPAPVPTPTVDDEELRKEAAAVEQEEEALAASVQPTSATVEEDVVSSRMLSAAKEITDEIEECDAILAQADADRKAKHDAIDNEYANLVEKTQTRRDEITSQFQNTLDKMQARFGVTPKVRKSAAKAPTKTRQTNGKGKPIRVLILDYLEKNRSARTSEIRTHLQSQGRTTNPGVELSRMVKDKSIINKERGMYTLGKSK